MPYSEETLKIIRQRYGYAEDDTSNDAEFQAMEPVKAFEALIGWTLGDHRWAKTILKMAGDCGVSLPDSVSTLNGESLRPIDVALKDQDGDQEVFIHKANRSFEIRTFKNGGCRLQIFNGASLSGENVMLNANLGSEQEALGILLCVLGLKFNLLRPSAE